MPTSYTDKFSAQGTSYSNPYSSQGTSYLNKFGHNWDDIPGLFDSAYDPFDTDGQSNTFTDKFSL